MSTSSVWSFEFGFEVDLDVAVGEVDLDVAVIAVVIHVFGVLPALGRCHGA